MQELRNQETALYIELNNLKCDLREVIKTDNISINDLINGDIPYSNKIKDVLMLIENNEDLSNITINDFVNDGYTLKLAIKYKCFKIAKLLIELGDNIHKIRF